MSIPKVIQTKISSSKRPAKYFEKHREKILEQRKRYLLSQKEEK